VPEPSASSLPMPRRRPTPRVFALNDLMALGAMQALRDLSVAVPDDVAVVGYDDIPTVALMTPALTTVHQPAVEIGQRAADRVIDQLLGLIQADEMERTVLPVELRRRDSTGPRDRPERSPRREGEPT